jgi:hypothetical protein
MALSKTPDFSNMRMVLGTAVLLEMGSLPVAAKRRHSRAFFQTILIWVQRIILAIQLHGVGCKLIRMDFSLSGVEMGEQLQ